MVLEGRPPDNDASARVEARPRRYGIDFSVDDSAISAWARRAHDQKTGARGLATVVDETLRGFKFELPGSSCVELRVDAAAVAEPEKAVLDLLEKADPKRAAVAAALEGR